MKKSFLWLLLVFLFPISAFAQTGTIEGTVYDQTTGKPLTGAEVHILEIDERQKSDADGKVWFTGVPPGTYTLTITHPSFATPTTTSVEVTAGHTTQARMSLGEVFELKTIVVEGERVPPTVSRKDIRGSELLRIAGVGTDALKGLTTLPSIGIPNDFFGVLYIRGSDPGSNLYYLDRTPLGYPFHWGGLLSTISSETIDKIDIYAGGYGAQFGLDSQSVIDIHARDNIEERLDGKFNLNIWYSEGLLEGKIGEKGYLSASGRRSYFDLIVGPIAERQTGREQQFPYFSDYQLKLAYPITENHDLTVNAFAATDHFDFELEEEVNETEITDNEIEATDGETETQPFQASFFFKNGFNGQGIHLRSKFTENLRSHLSLTRSFNFLDIDMNTIVSETTVRDESGELISKSTDSFDLELKVNVPVYTLREDLYYRLSPKLQLEPGFLFAFSPANSTEFLSFPTFEEEVLDEETLQQLIQTNPEKIGYDDDGNARIRTTEIRDYEFGHDLQRVESYLQTRYDPLPALSVAFGVRLDYLDLIEQLSIQPRGSVSIELPIGSNLRFAYGHYEQSPQLSQLLSENGNATLKSSLAQHYIMEIEHELSSQTEFKFATYYKNVQKLVTENEASNFLNQGNAFVGGVEAFLRHRVPDKFFGWISYSYTHAEQQESPNVAYQPYIFNNTHIVSIVANYNFSPDFEIGAKWQYLSGTSGAPFSTMIPIQDPVTRGLNPLFAGFDRIVRAKLTPYHRLDFRISKKWNLFGMKIGGFIEILNVYNRKNTIQFIQQAGTFEVLGEEITVEEHETEEEESNQLPLLPYFGLTIEF
ncbi:MAG: TonB-dependent receptor [Candidatus Poribacteria bacterium]|nr:TonB-dependent receptor [Candidatus Poribacteria bacterium]